MNLIIVFHFETIEKKLIFLDNPDGKLKQHRKPISLLGGTIILFNFYLSFFCLNLFNLNDLIFNTEFIYIIILLSTLFFIVGLIDDLKNLSPNLKLLLICLSFVLIVYFFPDIKLKYIKISFIQKTYYFQKSFWQMNYQPLILKMMNFLSEIKMLL